MDDTPSWLAPVLVVDLFNEIRANLLELLEALAPEHRHQPTAAPHWSVKDEAGLAGAAANLKSEVPTA
jgi:hypothetical protein